MNRFRFVFQMFSLTKKKKKKICVAILSVVKFQACSSHIFLTFLK